MKIELNKNGDGEIIFSWKEIWILIKKKKFVIHETLIDQLTVSLINMKQEILKKRNIEDKK
jgi:hypothetical protein